MNRPACAHCSTLLLSVGGVTCPTCESSFHSKCAKLKSGQRKGEWDCPKCSAKNVRSTELANENSSAGKSDGDDIDSPPDLVDVHKEIRLVYTEIKNMKNIISEFREEMKFFAVNMKNCEGMIEKVSENMKSLEHRIETIESTQAIASDVDSRVLKLEEALNIKSQEVLLNDLEITGIPERSGENVQHIIGLVAFKVGMDLQEQDIVDAYRVGARSREGEGEGSSGRGALGPRPIILRLARRTPRDNFLRCARVKRNLKTNDIELPGPPRRIYVNERLTRQNKLLFRQAREMAKELKWRYTWTKNGKILAKKGEDQPQVHHIVRASDIEKVFGTKIVIEKDSVQKGQEKN
ncbi:hypothetical protein NE865_14033 [Phthorimaea operculella]|nr:hypothetical protein NE865_14033 [Phthorimaea operculella]